MIEQKLPLFVAVPLEVMRCDKITQSAKFVYSIIISLIQHYGIENCYPSNAYFAKYISISKCQAERAVKELRDLGYIECFYNSDGRHIYDTRKIYNKDMLFEVEVETKKKQHLIPQRYRKTIQHIYEIKKHGSNESIFTGKINMEAPTKTLLQWVKLLDTLYAGRFARDYQIPGKYLNPDISKKIKKVKGNYEACCQLVLQSIEHFAYNFDLQVVTEVRKSAAEKVRVNDFIYNENGGWFYSSINPVIDKNHIQKAKQREAIKKYFSKEERGYIDMIMEQSIKNKKRYDSLLYNCYDILAFADEIAQKKMEHLGWFMQPLSMLKHYYEWLLQQNFDKLYPGHFDVEGQMFQDYMDTWCKNQYEDILHLYNTNWR